MKKKAKIFCEMIKNIDSKNIKKEFTSLFEALQYMDKCMYFEHKSYSEEELCTIFTITKNKKKLKKLRKLFIDEVGKKDEQSKILKSFKFGILC